MARYAKLPYAVPADTEGRLMLYRLRTDFQLTIITLFGACGAIGVLPFAAYRFLTGEIVVGIIDTALSLCISAAVVYAWRTGDTRRAGLFLVVVNTAGTGVVATILGVAGLFWIYAVLLSNFFLVDRRLAAVFTAATLVILAVHDNAFDTTPQMISFLFTASLVSLFAFIFATRTESQRLQLETLATRDPLTGAGNRRAMETELQLAVETLKRSRLRFGLVMLDLDHFKRVNDQHGHDAGDRVLIAFADLIQRSTRKVDRLFRFGGEEFVLLLPGTDVVGLQRAIANLQSRIATGLCGPAGPVTASLGAATLWPDEDWPSWLARADAALFQAKADGRNRAVVNSAEAAAGL